MVAYVRDGRQRIGVAADGWVELTVGDSPTQTCLALELDRGTEERELFQKKIRGRVRWAEGEYQSAFETESLTITYVTTAGPTRLAHLIAWTEKQLSEMNSREMTDLFWFAALDPFATAASEIFLAPHFIRPFDPVPQPLLDLDQATVA